MNVYTFDPSLFNIVTFSLLKLIVAVTSWDTLAPSSVGFAGLYSIVPIGSVLSIQSTSAVAVPLFPASSIYSKICVPFSVNVYVLPPTTVTFCLLKLIVATTFWFVGFSILYLIVATGGTLSIQVTLALAEPEFPYGPTKLNVYSPFSVNVCVFPPSTVTPSKSKLIVATTSSHVNLFAILYVIVAFGSVLRIQSTFATAVPLFPALSTKLKVYSPLSSKVCVFPPSTVTFSSSKVMLAVTGLFVFSVVLYVIVASGTFLSIQVTSAVAVPVLPVLSTYLNICVPFSVNVYLSPFGISFPSSSTIFTSS